MVRFLKDLLIDFSFWILLPILLIAFGLVLFWLSTATSVAFLAVLGIGFILVGAVWLLLVWLANSL